jgi:hypothetical protein
VCVRGEGVGRKEAAVGKGKGVWGVEGKGRGEGVAREV